MSDYEKLKSQLLKYREFLKSLEEYCMEPERDYRTQLIEEFLEENPIDDD